MINPFQLPLATASEFGSVKTASGFVACDTGNGYGSSSNKIRRFSNRSTFGTAITATDDASLGTYFTINEAGIYAISYSDTGTAASVSMGVSIDTTQPTIAIGSINPADRIAYADTSATGFYMQVTSIVPCVVGDVIRAHTDGGAMGATTKTQFRITQIYKF